MIAALHLPATLMDQPLSVCGVPAALAELLTLHGKSVSDPIGDVWTDSGLVPVMLQNEFQEAVGYRFDWGWVIPSMPRWYIDEGKSAPIAWRFVPVALWQEFAQTQRLHEPMPELLRVAAQPVLDCITQADHHPCALWLFKQRAASDVPYRLMEPTLAHDLCTFSEWIGKPGLVLPPERYGIDPALFVRVDKRGDQAQTVPAVRSTL